VSDFFSRLEDELAKAAERRAQRRLLPQMRWTRRTVLVLIPATALIAVPAFAAVTGVFHASHKRLVNLNPKPCVQRTPLRPRTSNLPPPPELTSILGVLRRPSRPADRMSGSLTLLPFVAGINPDYVRVRHPGPPPATLIILPAQNIRAQQALPNTSACKLAKGPRQTPQSGVCLIERFGSGAGGGCFTAAQIRRGALPGALSGGMHGAALVAGLVPDGVTRVTLTFRRHRREKRVELPVVDNTYAVMVKLRFGIRPRVVWHRQGTHQLVSRGGSPLTTRQRLLNRRSLERDLAATRVPSIFPPAGHAKTLFTMRVRPPLPRSWRAMYVVTLVGRNSANCRQRGRRDLVGYQVGRSGRRKGLLVVAFVAQDMGGGSRWCRGLYRGQIELWPHGFRHGFSHHLYARFRFSVR
jgi:hypothetical protein